MLINGLRVSVCVFFFVCLVLFSSTCRAILDPVALTCDKVCYAALSLLSVGSVGLGWQGRGAGVTITPYAAGRMIGAAVWRISWQTEDNDIVYATAYNHKPER